MCLRNHIDRVRGFVSCLPITALSLVILATGISIVNMYFATGDYRLAMLASYFQTPIIALLNTVPIVLIILLLFSLTRKVWLSFLLTSILTITISLVNYFKITIRNDPLIMKDLTLINEATNMMGEFSFSLNWQIIITIVSVIIITIILKMLYITTLSKKIRIVSTVTVIMICATLFSTVYTSAEIYEAIENYELINRWSQTQNYISRGFIYPFIYSYTSLFDHPPNGYQEEVAISILERYSSDDIENERKVDVIAIMLEGYNDFSKFSEVDFKIDVYNKWHALVEESVSGEIVNNIFAGETVDTEWGFLTGYTNYHEFRSMTNSYVHYFANQGYLVEGSHPCYQWFYNRENVNEYLGFDNYYYFENHYGAIANNTIARDRILLPEIIRFYEIAKEQSNPYFSFSVTYQNHGPYPATHTGDIVYINDMGISQASFNILNNYLAGIYDTNQQVSKFIDYFREQDATVIILFGDHNPWLGDNNSVYHELGINIDLDTEEGFYNYYNTPYLIWANDEAKKVLENDFIGQGRTIGPYFLMNEFFDLAGYQGNAFMKISNELRDKTTLVHRDGYFKVDGNLTRELNNDAKSVLEKFLIAQYYYRNNFLN